MWTTPKAPWLRSCTYRYSCFFACYRVFPRIRHFDCAHFTFELSMYHLTLYQSSDLDLVSQTCVNNRGAPSNRTSAWTRASTGGIDGSFFGPLSWEVKFSFDVDSALRAVKLNSSEKQLAQVAWTFLPLRTHFKSEVFNPGILSLFLIGLGFQTWHLSFRSSPVGRVFWLYMWLVVDQQKAWKKDA